MPVRGRLYFLLVFVYACLVSSSCLAQIGGEVRVIGNCGGCPFVEGAPATTVSLSTTANSIALDGSGNLLIAEGHYIRKIAATTGVITTIAGGGSSGADGIPATNAAIWARDICVNGSGDIYIADRPLVRKVDGHTGIITTIAGGGYSIAEGVPATAANMNLLKTLCLDSQGNCYVAMIYNVRKISAATGLITTIAGGYYGGGVISGDGGAATNATFAAIENISVDNRGNVYIVDHGTNLRKIDSATGIIHTVFGGGVIPLIVAEGVPAASVELRYLTDVVVDPNGNCFVAEDDTDNALWRIDATTGIVNQSAYLNVTWGKPICICLDTSDGLLYCGYPTDLGVSKFTEGILGNLKVCIGSTSSLTCLFGYGGGVWSSSNTTIATIGSSSGVVTSISPGTSTIAYISALGRTTSVTVTINPLPAAITGPPAVCAGQAITLANTSSGGTWASSTSTSATIGSSSGTVTGVSAGTSRITYTLATGCKSTTSVIVHPLPALITGNRSMCQGFVTTLSDATPGGTWTSVTTAVATIGSTGMVAGLSPGTSIITYTLGTGCIAFTVATVNPLPTPILGVTGVCLGLTSTLGHAGGGTWSSSATSIVSIGSVSGILTSLSLGSALLTYTLPTGCMATTTATPLPLPTGIIGTPMVCAGSATTLSNASPGGTWLGVNTAIATIGAGTGILRGVAAGTTTISYIVTITGCVASVVVTVNPLPVIPAGQNVCAGATTTLSGSPTGAWSIASTTTATVSGSGLATGNLAGTTLVNYTIGTGCMNTTTLLVNPLPSVITGNRAACVGLTGTLSNAAAGGYWTSSIPAFVSIGSASGVFSGLTLGASSISYTLSSTGCAAGFAVTVNPLPTPIIGVSHVCPGATITLTNLSPGGTWSTSNVAVGTISPAGVLTGITAGGLRVTYTAGTGCFTTTSVTVDVGPTAIIGPANICISRTATLSSAPGGGVWTTSNPGITTMGVMPGTVIGANLGTARISYALSSGCAVGTTVTITSGPAAISGVGNLCAGAISTLSDATSGGTWTSALTAIASVGSSSGVITGLSAGATNITYSLGGSCRTSISVTVDPQPPAITGPTSVCAGTTATLSNSALGVWSSGAPSVAGIGSSTGIVLGVSAGTAQISYTASWGCARVTTVTVGTAPVILGVTAFCAGATSSLSNTSSGGAWSFSGAAGIATVGAANGVVSGIGFGTAILTYAAPGGCTATTTITISPGPGPISGPASVCVGATSTLSNTVPGGAWTSGAAAIGTIDPATGVVTGRATGTAMISYSLGGGCVVSKSVTVRPPAGTISGATRLCPGVAVTYSVSGSSGGTWSSASAGTLVNIGSATGIVTGLGTGSVIIQYTNNNGCQASMAVTVNPVTPPITGSPFLCIGGTSTLSTATPGGTWTCSVSSNISISLGGVVTATGAGTATITYVPPSGCPAYMTVTAYPAAAAITGNGRLCAGSATTLSHVTAGGIWSPGATGIASIGSITGIVNGLSAGVTVVTYTVPTGCMVLRTVTVDALPAPIVGSGSVCVGAASTLSNSVTGGAWSSSGPVSIGTSSGIIIGISAGTASITYSTGAGCAVTTVVTVSPQPPSISGTAAVCAGSVTTLYNSVTGGTWSTVATTVGPIAIGGGGAVITGLLTGTATITYTAPSGCATTSMVTVNPLPASIVGTANVCVGATTSLTSTTPGGTWVSGNTTVASIGAGLGALSGVSTGSAAIMYTIGTGCSTSTTVTVVSLPPAITGVARVCAGATTTLSNPGTGGTWTEGGTGNAVIDLFTGVVTGINAGAEQITYTALSGCEVHRAVTVNPIPAITGGSNVCIGSSITLSSPGTIGTWTATSGTGSVSAGVGTGAIRGLAIGTATVSYVGTSGCAAAVVISVDPLPPPITGAGQICGSQALTLSDALGGGTWSSSNTAQATVDLYTGVVTGLGGGYPSISYNVGGCSALTTMTINALPAPITGADSICAWGSTITVHDADAPAGSWSSTLVSINPSGLVTGFAPGVGTITYTLPSGCFVTATIQTNPLPSAISGPNYVCLGGTISLTDATTGGTWSSSASAVSVGAGAVVTGIANGSAIITYTIPRGACTATKTVDVNPRPAAIAGPIRVCVGSTITLSDSTSGGVWSSGSATVGVAPGGVISGLTPGTASVTYAVTNLCGTIMLTKSLTIDPLPNAGTITGPGDVCKGETVTLSDLEMGGLWSSGNTSIATIGSATGAVNGLEVGTSAITYSVTNICGKDVVTQTITVGTIPDALTITGAGNMCAGKSITLSATTADGVWSSGNTGIASVGSATGVVSGHDIGTAAITYTTSNKCGVAVATHSLALITVPSSTITASATHMCIGATVTLSHDVVVGLWMYSNAILATYKIDETRTLVKGMAAGLCTIIHKQSNECGMEVGLLDLTVDEPDAGLISGKDTLCVGDSIAITNNKAGGTWGIANGLASISNSGIVSGLQPGRDTVTYTVAQSGCSSTATYQIDVLSTTDCEQIVAKTNGIGCSGSGEINIYPNPAKEGSFTVSLFSPFNEDANIVITNVLGQKVRRIQTATNAPLEIRLDVPPGVYTVLAITAHGKCIEKVTLAR